MGACTGEEAGMGRLSVLLAPAVLGEDAVFVGEVGSLGVMGVSVEEVGSLGVVGVSVEEVGSLGVVGVSVEEVGSLGVVGVSVEEVGSLGVVGVSVEEVGSLGVVGSSTEEDMVVVEVRVCCRQLLSGGMFVRPRSMRCFGLLFWLSGWCNLIPHICIHVGLNMRS
jgi:hypothetical protein